MLAIFQHLPTSFQRFFWGPVTVGEVEKSRHQRREKQNGHRGREPRATRGIVARGAVALGCPKVGKTWGNHLVRPSTYVFWLNLVEKLTIYIDISRKLYPIMYSIHNP